MNIYLFIYIILFFSLSYSQNSQTDIFIDNLNPKKHDAIYLNLEPYRKTIFLLDPIFHSITKDINYLNFKIDGSMMYPIYNSIPKPIFLSSADTSSSSQLSFLQDHNEYFYDTSIALKSYLRKDVNLLTQFESKSRKRRSYDDVGTKGINYDQKIMTSIYKDNGHSLIDAGYMYHYEEIPTYINQSDYEISNPSFRSAESYNFKFYYEHENEKLSFKNNSNRQITNYLRPYYSESSDSLEYLTETNWNTLIFDYTINEKHILNFESNYKFSTSDSLDIIFLDNHYHKISLGSTMRYNIHHFSFGIDKFKEKHHYHYFNYTLNLNRFKLVLLTENNPYMNIKRNNDSYHMNKILSKHEMLGLNFKNEYINTSLNIGNHTAINQYSYLYYQFINELVYEWISIGLLYNNYETNELPINNYMNLSVKFSPKFKNKRFRPYAKMEIYNLGINNDYTIEHNRRLDLYGIDDSQEGGGLNITNLEFGVIFNYFSIAFIYEHYYRQQFIYGYDPDYISNPDEPNQHYFSIYNHSDYLINITWIFKD